MWVSFCPSFENKDIKFLELFRLMMMDGPIWIFFIIFLNFVVQIAFFVFATSTESTYDSGTSRIMGQLISTSLYNHQLNIFHTKAARID